MKILSLCLVPILCLAMSFAMPISAASYDFCGSAYLLYEYDFARSLLIVSVRYVGEKISAIGFEVKYDTGDMDYTSFDGGMGFSGFNISATLFDSGSVRVIAYSPDLRGDGEIIRLCFKIHDKKSEHLVFSLLPLTEKPCAVIVDGRAEAVDVSFFGTSIRLPPRGLQTESIAIERSGKMLISAKADGACFFDITVVELCGKIRRDEAFCQRNALVKEEDGYGLYTANIGEIPKGYVAVIVDIYGKCGENILAGREIFLLCDGIPI